MKSGKNPYHVLRLEPSASAEEIRKAFRALAREYHPDTNPSVEAVAKFREISEAYKLLSDAEKKEQYDRKHGKYSDSNKEKIRQYKKNDEAGNKHPHNSSGPDIKCTIDQTELNVRLIKKETRKKRSTTSRHISQVVKNTFGKLGAAAEKIAKKSTTQIEALKPAPSPNQFIQRLRGQRDYKFTVDALESIFGVTRFVVIKKQDKQHKLSIKIPPGTFDGMRLTVRSSDTALGTDVPINVKVIDHWLVSREDKNICLRIPVTKKEAEEGAEMLVPVIDGFARLKLPEGWKGKGKLRLAKMGPAHPKTQEKSDIFIKTHFAECEEGKSCESVRSHLPKTLRELFSKERRVS